MPSKSLANWKPEPIQKPAVDRRLKDLDALSRSIECVRYSLLSIEHWISPDGQVRELLRRNLLLCAFLLITAMFVMPVVDFILWQLNGWFSMLSGIIGKIILILLFLIVLRVVISFLKR